MKLKVLDRKDFQAGKSWFLCKANLYEFLTSLKKDFYEFQVQRRIVRNVYLDKLYQTIEEGFPIPPITLCADKIKRFSTDEIELNFQVEKIDIIDGLQRTFRLWIFLELQKIIEANNLNGTKELIEYLKQKDEDGQYILNLDFINVSYLKMFFNKEAIDKRLEAYHNYDVNLVIWTGLSDSEIVEKMLILNAGQRPVSSTHQYELLFLHYFEKDKIKLPENIQLVREKEQNYFKVHRGERTVGQYTLASIIIALQSYIEQKPLRVAPTNYLEFDTSSSITQERVQKYFRPQYLSQFIESIYSLDSELSKVSGYVKWFGKDTTLSGIYAALGYLKMDAKDLLESIINKRFDFDLENFNKEYDFLASTKVNVGNVVRKAIFKYCLDELSNGQANWKRAFNNIDAYDTI